MRVGKRKETTKKARRSSITLFDKIWRPYGMISVSQKIVRHTSVSLADMNMNGDKSLITMLPGQSSCEFPEMSTFGISTHIKTTIMISTCFINFIKCRSKRSNVQNTWRLLKKPYFMMVSSSLWPK